MDGVFELYFLLLIQGNTRFSHKLIGTTADELIQLFVFGARYILIVNVICEKSFIRYFVINKENESFIIIGTVVSLSSKILLNWISY